MKIEGTYFTLILMSILMMIIQARIKMKIDKINKKGFVIWIYEKKGSINLFMMGFVMAYTLDHIKYSKIILGITLVISVILSVRFILKLIYYKEFESYIDLICGAFSLMMLIVSLDIILPTGAIINYFFRSDMQSYVFQLLIFHICFLIIVYVLFMAIVYSGVLVGSIFSITITIPLSNKDKKGKIRNKLSSIKRNIEKISNKFIGENIFKIFNKYFNPKYGIEWIPLYKNIGMIRTMILVSYIITGIAIIYYWKDLITFINTNQYFNFLSYYIKEIEINPSDFESYRLIFIIPLIGILTGKLSKKNN